MPRINASNDFFIRTSDPEHEARVQEVLQRVHDNGHVYKGHVRGLVLPALRGLQDRDRDRPRATPARSTASRSTASRRRTGSSGSRPSRSRSSGSTPSGPTSSLPPQRYNEALSFITRRPAGRLAQPREAHLGRRGPVGSRARLLRLVRRAPELLHGALVRAPARTCTEALLAGRRYHLIGKDILKFHAVYLAGAAAWPPASRCPAAPLHPRLPACRTPGRGVKMSKSLGQRARPVRGHRQVRHGRAALLLLPRGLLRPGRRGLHRPASRRATRPSSPTTTATSPAARSR